MNRFFYILFSLILLSSCSKNEPEPINAVACFKILQDTISYNQTIDIEECSENAKEFSYSLNGNLITLEELLLTKHSVGDQRISLQVISETGDKQYATHNFYVLPKHESFYIPTELVGANRRLLAFDRNPVRDKMFTVFEHYIDDKYYYAEISDDLEMSIIELNNRSSKTGFQRALCFFQEDGILNIDIPHPTAVSLQRSRLWVNPETGESGDPISLVSFDFDTAYITFKGESYSSGAHFENMDGIQKYIPAINRFSAGNTSSLKEYNFEDRSGIIGNFIPYKNEFLAHATSFNLEWGPDHYGTSDQRSHLLKLDSDFNLIETIDLSILDDNTDLSIPTYNSPLHMLELPNNKILIYGQSNFRILNDDLTIVHEEFLQGWGNQSVLLLDNSIILSQNNFIKKFDFEGNLLAKFDYGQQTVYGILPLRDNIIFMSQVRSWSGGEPEGGTLYFGMLDKDLNLLELKK